MNSTLQCLSATYPFTSYFLDGGFRRSINEKNPLGMGGRLAIAFAELLKALWKEEYTFLSPVTFRVSRLMPTRGCLVLMEQKNIISFASQFSGTDQHDSQEFLSFVLDGLHEDLNRIKVKPPPVDMSPEREARLETLPPELASEQEWDIYKQRNDSFIVDLFQGQYRNRLECLTCHKVWH
jgi:ubiquitin carboxyl-terminal hydrolase 8